MLDFLHSLSPLTAAGMAVWLQHHPRKGRTPSGQASRGSGALPGFVDILMACDGHFIREVYEGLDTVLPLGEIGIELPLAEIYETAEFTPEAGDDEGP